MTEPVGITQRISPGVTESYRSFKKTMLYGEVNDSRVVITRDRTSLYHNQSEAVRQCASVQDVSKKDIGQMFALSKVLERRITEATQVEAGA